MKRIIGYLILAFVIPCAMQSVWFVERYDGGEISWELFLLGLRVEALAIVTVGICVFAGRLINGEGVFNKKNNDNQKRRR